MENYCAKYYVVSGSLRVLVEVEGPRFAALEAMARVDSHKLGDAFYVDERGFRTDHAAHQFELWEIIAEYTEEIHGCEET